MVGKGWIIVLCLKCFNIVECVYVLIGFKNVIFCGVLRVKYVDMILWNKCVMVILDKGFLLCFIIFCKICVLCFGW